MFFLIVFPIAFRHPPPYIYLMPNKISPAKSARLLAEFQSAIIEHVRANTGDSTDEAVAAVLPAYLKWEGTGYSGALRGSSHGGGMAPESAGFDTFELDTDRTPEWAVAIFEGLPKSTKEQITTEAEEAEIERMMP